MTNTDTKSGKAALVGALAVVILGAWVLAGWFFDLEVIKRILPGRVAMNPATAVAFILAGISLILFLRWPPGRADKSPALVLTAHLCALAVMLIGLAKLVASLGGWDIGIDRWLFASKFQEGHDLMAQNSAFNFVLLGAALLFVDRKSRPVRGVIEFFSLLVSLGALLAILSYAYDIRTFYGLGAWIQMGFHTAIAFFVLSCAIFLSHTDSGFPAVFASNTAGGTMARRLLPAAVLVPGVLGWLRLQGEMAGLYHGDFGAVVFAVGTISVFTFLVCWSAKVLFKADLERNQAEETMRRQQTELRVLFDLMPAFIFFKDTENRILRVNQRVAAARGKAIHEIEGKSYQEIYPDDSSRFYADDLEVIRSGASKLGIVGRIHNPEGKELWVQTDKVPVCDKAGKVTGIVVMVQDITERKRTEQNIQHLAAIIENSEEAIISKTLNGIITSWNPAAEIMFGYTADEIIGKPLLVLVPPDLHHEEAEILAGFARGELVRHFETVRIRKGGQRFEVSTSISPIRAPDGRVLGASKIVRDITERKRVDAALRQSQVEYRSLFEAMLEGYCYCRGLFEQDQLVDFTYLQVNKAFEALTGLTDVVGKNASTLIPGIRKTNPELFQRYGRVALTGTPEKYESLIESLGMWFSVAVYSHEKEHFVVVFENITERKRAETLLTESRKRLALATGSAQIGVWDWDVVANKMIWDSQMYKLYGIRQEDFTGAYDAWEHGLHPEDRPRAEAEIAAALKGAKTFDTEFRVQWPSGEVRNIEAHGVVQHAEDGSVTQMIGVNWDITDRKRSDAKLLQSQKLETVGKLAGGIAHEFNSILTAIIGQSNLLLDELPSGSPLAAKADEISKAAGRAATLTRQLLAYSRKQTLRPEILDLNRVIASMEGMCQRLMGASVKVRVVSAEGLHSVKADAGQLEHVIVNMAINAREAMPQGGELTLETTNVTLAPQSEGPLADVKPGEYVMLAISDTGTGMNAQVEARAFEPFFTTKTPGEGSGLGLSMCYGIVKQSGGHISVDTESSQGTTFKIYLPRVEPEAKSPVRAPASPGLPRGTETILLVEEDPALRDMAAGLLSRLGYTPLAAANGTDAIALLAQPNIGQIDLLFIDGVALLMDGEELAQRLLNTHPHARILTTSTHADSAGVSPSQLTTGAALLQKPFSPSALAHKLREVLDQARKVSGG